MPDLPFHVGELAESRCFQSGFRGAWFRCKIREIRMKSGAISHLLEYFDYADQKPSWIRLYQKPPANINKSKGFNRELMVRPSFPTVYRENEKFEVNTISEVSVIVDNVWKIGDLVDWYKDNCYWSGTVTKISGNDEVQIDLLPPPLGEGKSYKALSMDLRPSLDWCPERGWTVPTPMGGGCCRPCARIVNPANSGGVGNIHATDGTVKVGESLSNFEGLLDRPERSMARRKQSNTASNGMDIDESDNKIVRTVSSSRIMDASIENSEKATVSGGYDEYPTRKMRRQCKPASNDMDIDESDNKIGITVSSSRIMDASIENSEKATISGGYDEYPTKMRSYRNLSLNSISSNTMEAAILDLEELVNRIKWLKDVLNLGVPLSGTKQSWEFTQHHAPCK